MECDRVIADDRRVGLGSEKRTRFGKNLDVGSEGADNASAGFGAGGDFVPLSKSAGDDGIPIGTPEVGSSAAANGDAGGGIGDLDFRAGDEVVNRDNTTTGVDFLVDGGSGEIGGHLADDHDGGVCAGEAVHRLRGGNLVTYVEGLGERNGDEAEFGGHGAADEGGAGEKNADGGVRHKRVHIDTFGAVVGGLDVGRREVGTFGAADGPALVDDDLAILSERDDGKKKSGDENGESQSAPRVGQAGS